MARSYELLVSLLTSAALAGVVSASAAHELRGRVLDDATGGPVTGATVVATAGTRSWRTTPGADGTFRLPLPADADLPLRLQVTAPGFEAVELEVGDPSAEVLVRLSPTPVFAGEVEVTAVRARVGETPVTVSNVGRDEIERGYWGQDVPMFLSQVPGFYAYNDNGNDVGYSYFQLRGFDMRRTAVTLNGVPLNDAHSHGVFFVDLADFLATTGDIQVQRGVGTNLYGGSAIGGSVDFRTRAPLADQRLRLSALRGAWDTTRWTVEYDSGLSDSGWAATFRWSRVESDGYRDQSWTSMWNYHLAVEHYGERSNLRLLLFGGPEDTHLAYEGVGREYLEGQVTGDRRRDRRYNPFTYPNEVDHFFQPHYQLVHSWQLTPALTFQNTLFYFEGDGYYEQFRSDRWMPEYDLEPFPGPGGELVDTTDLVRRRQVAEWDGGWIPYLEWRHGGGRGTLQAGAALRLHQGRHWGAVTWAEHYPPDLPPNHRYYDYGLDKTSVQPFVQETWRLGRRFTLLGGLTWTSHRYEMGEDRLKGVEVDETFSYPLPRLGVTFRPGPTWSLYANLSRGGREPAFRDLYDPQDYWSQPVELEPEELVDSELGGELRWTTGSARLNLYWLHFSNEIVWAGGLDTNGVPVTANGAVTDHRGVELEVTWSPRPRWGGRLGASWARNTFDEFVEYDWDGNPTDHAGNWIAGTPDRLASLELTGGYGPVDAQLSIRHAGRFYLDNTESADLTNDAFTAVNLAVRVDLGAAVCDLVAARSATVDVRVNNLTDSLYTTFGYVDGGDPRWIPAATRSLYAGLTVDW